MARKRTGKFFKCLNCGKDVYRSAAELRKGTKNVYCSQSCCIEYRKKHKEINPRYTDNNTMQCDYCGKEIRVSSDKQKRDEHHFCSKECFNRYKAQNWIGVNSPRYKGALMHKFCDVCGKNFSTYTKTQLSCSRKCSQQKMERKTILKCDYCGNEYCVPLSAKEWADKRNHNHNFCSKECRVRYFTGERSPNWITDRSLLKDEDHNERQKSDMKLWREMVFKRDDYTCQLCGKRSHSGSPLILNAHHIKPFSKYKELRTEVGNGITLCENCHKQTYKKESDYERMFSDIIKRKS